MADNSDALRRSRRKDSSTKRRRATEVLEAMIDTGDAVTFPAVARRAGVSVSLLYADRELAGRVSEARSHQREVGTERCQRVPTRSLASEQSLRADLANANDRARRLNDELAVLRERLTRLLGAQSDVASGRSTSPLLERLEEQVGRLEADNSRLRDQVHELEAALRESNDTLEAARAVNRELMAEINRSERLDSTSVPTNPAPVRGQQVRRRPGKASV